MILVRNFIRSRQKFWEKKRLVISIISYVLVKTNFWNLLCDNYQKFLSFSHQILLIKCEIIFTDDQDFCNSIDIFSIIKCHSMNFGIRYCHIAQTYIWCHLWFSKKNMLRSQFKKCFIIPRIIFRTLPPRKILTSLQETLLSSVWY